MDQTVARSIQPGHFRHAFLTGETMDSITDLLDQIEQRPAMYIGERSIMCLKAFIDGWMFGSGSNSDDSEFMLGFQRWVEKRFAVTSTQSWAQIIAFYSSDQMAALDEALNLFKEYRAAN